ncbi:MAG: class I SAM-dependent methyltransferase [Deltaproteobacteria bacterium]|jgi:SAM-dependent methyltransferase|nr:class I SAM-dependent methyltransferase [Deltaproteobacteria bacterium]
MQNMKTFAKNHLPKSLVELTRTFLARNRSKYGNYSSITLTDEDIEQCTYKKYLGGGSKSWETRGTFQLLFLQAMGMHKNSKLLDVGCGPGRASKHLIDFLEDNNYCGVDYNADFIKAARAMSEQNKLAVKNPIFEVIHNFSFEHIKPIFDYAIVFSVLNHCNIEQRKAFFRMIPGPLKEDGKVYISHARWFDESYIEKTRMSLTNQFESNNFDVIKFGWPAGNGVLPIIELTMS